MKLVKYKTSLATDNKYPGVVEAKFTHEIRETKAELKYLGPVIPYEVWQQVLSFFRWTYDKTKSESQVRLYISCVQQTWAAWAYPQEAQTGMSAHEINNDEAKKQRAVFTPDTGDQWIYFGTVHHHCSAGAFQSGTDESNESDQVGLHITVGCIDKDRHDLHCRFYLNGAQFDPDMSLFWDIGADLRDRIPSSLWDSIARYQMCKASTVEFPQQWKDNLIEVKKTYGQGGHFRYDGGAGYVSSGTGASVSYPSYGSSGSFDNVPEWQKAKYCYECIVRELAQDGYMYSEIVETINLMRTNELIENIMTNCKYFKVDFEDVFDYWPNQSQELEEMAENILRANNYGLDEEEVGKGKRRKGHKASEPQSKPPANTVPPQQHHNKENPSGTNTTGGSETDITGGMSGMD